MYITGFFTARTISDFTGLLNLQVLYLNHNQLTGIIPDLSTLPNLKDFYFVYNNLILDCNTVTDISQIECESLLQLYHSTDGNNWNNNEGWNVTNTPCSWTGVTCENGSVTVINLIIWHWGDNSPTYGNNLNGTLPNFKGLPNLTTLILSENEQLTGPIPDFNGLPTLQTLYLDRNQLTGPIPDFTGLPTLQTLALYGNQLTGTIPNFSSLPLLQMLNLKWNQLTSTIPDFSGLPNLQTLNLENNQLTGIIPNFSALPDLQELNLNRNQLIGETPDFSALPNLEKLELSYNKLTGTILDFSALPNLLELNLEHNQLTGEIPDFSALPRLEGLKLFYNQLTGTVTNFSALPKLRWLHLDSNQLTGAIPNFSALPNLRTLFLGNNSICKDTNINYPSWLDKQISRFPKCSTNDSPLATVEMQLNQGFYTTGDSIRLDMQVDGQVTVDLYIAIVFPNGDFITIAPPFAFSQFNAIQIYKPAITITQPKTYTIMDDFLVLDDTAKGQYRVCGILVLVGTDPNEQNNWIYFSCRTFVIH